MSATKGSSTVTLSGGRRLAYAEYGDPSGAPLVIMHGFPDCRLTRHPDDARTASLGVRVIIPDRPGIGASDRAPARSVLDRADDIARLADHLGLDRFAALGWSAGGPYALACAYRYPERLSAVGIACGMAPMDRPGATDGMPKHMQQFIPMVRRMPWLVRPMLSSLRGKYRKDPERAFRSQFESGLSPEDARVLEVPEIKENLLAGAVEAVRQGARGMATEMQCVFGRPWGFRPQDITAPVRLWYGDADAVVPLSAGRYLAGEIPNAQLTVCPGEGHMLFYTRWEEMLTTLTR
jgi:pimeloyl-ACP methyl ester carboxylesterase